MLWRLRWRNDDDGDNVADRDRVERWGWGAVVGLSESIEFSLADNNTLELINTKIFIEQF